MPLPVFTPAETVFEFSIKYKVNGQICRNFWHFRNRDQVPGSNALEVQDQLSFALMTAALGDWPALFLPAFGTNVNIMESSVQAVYPAPRVRRTVETLGIFGTGTATSPAQNIQASVSKFGDEANEHNRGGMRIGGVPEGTYSAGLFSPAQKAIYQSIIDVIYMPFSETIDAIVEWFDPVILNRTNVGTPENPLWVLSGSTLVTSHRVEESVRTQRTRTLGRGE